MKHHCEVSLKLDAAGKAATVLWQELKKGRTWPKWLELGDKLVILRQAAMYEAGIPVGNNAQPGGSAYNAAMGRLLARYKLDDIDKSDRARLITVMENRAAIEAWYATLPLNRRLNLNHPSAVLRRYEAENRVPKPKDPTKLSPLQKT